MGTGRLEAFSDGVLEGPGSRLRSALGNDLKGKVSPLIYVSVAAHSAD